MEEANEKCASIKQLYDNCFQEWYSNQFLKGDVNPGCQDEFLEYRECIVKVMQEKNKQGKEVDSKK